jgi:AcrR family transcriptional regulator
VPQRTPTRRERQREATYDEIVTTAKGLLASGEDLSLRAIATKMGMTAPALYRYVANYQELIDMVAFELDKEATAYFAERAEQYPADDPAARLTAASVGFRSWAMANPREFHLVFANPIAEYEHDRRDLLTVATSGLYLTDLLYEVWERYQHPIPSLADLPPGVAEAVLDPLIPAKAERIPRESRGLLWLYMRSWSALYGVVTLECSNHCDPRVIQSAALFRATLMDRLAEHGLADERDRLLAIMDAELATG